MHTSQGDSAFFHTPKGPMVLGEGPIYRSSDSTLLLVRLSFISGRALHYVRVIPLADSGTVACFRKNKPGSYIAAYYQGVCFLDEQTGAGRIDVVKEIIPASQRDELRFNDGGGALACGANALPADYGRPKGRLWRRYDPDGSLHLMIDGGIMCGNGLAWSPDNETMYMNDSVGQVVYAFDFDLATGMLSNQRILVDRRDSCGEPDGMIVDTQGNLWIAVYASSRMMVFSPEGEQLEEIVFPAKNVACTTWGGRNHDILYVASAVDTATDTTTDEGGHMFMYRGQARGRPSMSLAGENLSQVHSPST
ncbi:hypothetical protein BO71DRAFT_416351 [Aspergillus ellipticus CBS 707.79]|uniref:SMP-30/Gluconolactonase/LRE-like region domain-containing protein n=1 Tax=Aspergillus ellipticus CBS 707.79 TaxID=1448320 RepID=A0A319F1C5_9EURO|nr:hypothetical protein BO71DRAFT_416351 [Aspergillus ellipticus CBS 707.79]